MAVACIVCAEVLDGLTDEAKEIATFDACGLLVIAGFGAGKTQAMTRRIA